MKFFALFYYVVENFVERRAAYRAEHLHLAREARKRDELIFGGAMNDPADSALLIFRAPDRSVAEDFARHDPYVINRLVARWEVREWNVIVGNDRFDDVKTESAEK
jgi:uncharacterized protein YciI